MLEVGVLIISRPLQAHRMSSMKLFYKHTSSWHFLYTKISRRDKHSMSLIKETENIL